MTNLAQFFLDHYYSKYKSIEYIPTKDELVRILDLNDDKIVVVHKGMDILGAAIFLTLTDESYAKIKDITYFTVPVLISLLLEDGPNMHFIMVAGSGMKNIRDGVRAAVKARHPKTVSWWDPDNKRLHKYKLN